MDLVGTLIQTVIATVVLAPALWIAGRLVVGKDKAKFTDALWIVFLGTVIGAVGGALIDSLAAKGVGLVAVFIVWLALIRHFFDCGWLKALVISVVAVVVFVVIIAIVGIVVTTIGML